MDIAIAVLSSLRASYPIVRYSAIAPAPAFSSPSTINDSVGSSLESGELSGANDVLINQNAIPGLFNNRLRPNAISNKRFKSAGSTRIYVGGDNVTTGMQVIAPLNGSDNLSYYHLGIVGNSSLSQTGISGLNHLASVAGSTILADDLIIKNVEFAGVQINESTSGEKYASIILRNVRIFGYAQEGEGFYIGSTNKLSNFSTIDYCEIKNCLAYNKLREGLQLTHVADGVNAICSITENCTFYQVGQPSDMPEQQYLAQIHNTNGYCSKTIFHKGTRPANIFTHGYTFEDCYFEWDTDDPIYIGKLKDAGAFGASAIAGNGLPITFRRCYFNPSVNQTRLARILETDANVNFENCYFNTRISSGVVSNMLSDERAGSPSNTISNTGYTIGPPLESPTYNNFDPDQEETHGLCTSAFWLSKHMGYRTI